MRKGPYYTPSMYVCMYTIIYNCTVVYWHFRFHQIAALERGSLFFSHSRTKINQNLGNPKMTHCIVMDWARVMCTRLREYSIVRVQVLVLAGIHIAYVLHKAISSHQLTIVYSGGRVGNCNWESGPHNMRCDFSHNRIQLREQKLGFSRVSLSTGSPLQSHNT